MEDEGPTLSERMRDLKLREAGASDPAAVARALAEKATLSERMHAILEETASVPPSGDAEVARFADRLHAPASPGRAASDPRIPHGPAAAKAPEGRHWLRWLVGREAQASGKGPVTEIPPPEEGWEEADFYPIEPPYSFVRISREKATGQLRYDAIEPRLAERERHIFGFVQDALVRGLNVDPGPLLPPQREAYLLDAVRQILHDYRIRVDAREQARIEYYLRRDFLGLGPIHTAMNDGRIEDISCDGAAEPLFIYHRQHESIPSSIRFADDAELDAFVIRLAQRSGKAISISDPILDAALPDGSRLQATLGREVTQNGSTFTIRRFKPDPFTPLDLLRFGTMSVEMLAWFWLIVQHGHSLILSGGTASGKTTGLNAISQFIPPQAKVVSIEDTREVNLPHKNWIKAVTRSGSSTEGTGEIGMFELLKAALRQRPEYILVGEVRGIEATVAFQAMATGHTVYSTMHADSARSVVYRLENDPINIPRLVLQALDVIAIQAQTRFQGKRVRRVKEVVELVGMDPTTRELLTNTVFRWDPATDTFESGARSYLLEQIATERNWTLGEMEAEYRRRQQVLRRLLERGVKDVREITETVQAYYRDPQAVLARLGLEAAA